MPPAQEHGLIPDLFTPRHNITTLTTVDIKWSQIIQRFVIALIVIIFDKQIDLIHQFIRAVIIF